MNYEVTTDETVTKVFLVEADDPQEAIRLALEDASSLSHEKWGLERIEARRV
jgi:hypothetical protein